MATPTPVTGICRAPDCERPATTTVLVASERVKVCNRCRMRYARHGYFRVELRRLTPQEIANGRRLRELGLEFTMLAAHFRVSSRTAQRLWGDVKVLPHARRPRRRTTT